MLLEPDVRTHLCNTAIEKLMGASSCAQTVLMCFCYVRMYPWAQVHIHQHNSGLHRPALSFQLSWFEGLIGSAGLPPSCGMAGPPPCSTCLQAKPMPVVPAPYSHPTPYVLSGSQVVCLCHSAPRRTAGAARVRPMKLPPLSARMI